MSCIWSLATRLLATKTSKLEKKDVPGAANTTPISPRGSTSTVDLLSLVAASAEVESSLVKGSIGSNGLPAPELLAPPAEGRAGAICEPPPDNEPKRPPAPELPALSTDGGGGTTSEPAPESEPQRVPSEGPPEPCIEGGGGTTCEPARDNRLPKMRPVLAELPAP